METSRSNRPENIVRRKAVKWLVTISPILKSSGEKMTFVNLLSDSQNAWNPHRVHSSYHVRDSPRGKQWNAMRARGHWVQWLVGWLVCVSVCVCVCDRHVKGMPTAKLWNVLLSSVSLKQKLGNDTNDKFTIYYQSGGFFLR